MSLERGANA